MPATPVPIPPFRDRLLAHYLDLAEEQMREGASPAEALTAIVTLPVPVAIPDIELLATFLLASPDRQSCPSAIL